MAVNHHKRHIHNFMKNSMHPYYHQNHRTVKGAQHAPGSSVLQSLTRLLTGCRSMYGTSAGYYSPAEHHTVKTIPTGPQTNNKWIFRMSMQGFKSENVKISVNDSTVLVQAKFDEEKEKIDNGYGMTRTIAIPDSVIKDKVVGYLNEQQVLVIEAPYKVMAGQRDQVVPGMRRTSSSDLDDEELFNRPSNFVFNNECEVPKDPLLIDQDRLSESSNDPFSISTSECKNCDKKVSSDHSDKAQPSSSNFRLTINMQNVPSKYIEVSTKGRKLIVRCNIQRQLSGLSLKESYSTEYSLPSNVDMEGVKCVRSERGILTVTAPCIHLSTEERRIEIIQEAC